MEDHPSSKIKQAVRQLPRQPGVYLMKDRLGKILYVGKAKDLKSRVSSYFQQSRLKSFAQPKVTAMIPLIHHFDYITVRSEAEALLLEGKLIKQWKPKYNTDFVDDKRFWLVRLDMQNPMPRFRLTRLRKDTVSRYYGPFAHAGLLKKTLAQMRKQFGVMLGDAQPRLLEDGRYQLYDDVRAELYAHDNEVTVEVYAERVRQACQFLEGKTRDHLEETQQKMEEAAANEDFERAAMLRDLWFALKKTVEKPRKFVRDPAVDPGEARALLEETRQVLGLPGLPEVVECFDISHVSGSFVVASMVHFYRGRPANAQYRRYRIREKVGNDDFRSMEEVVRRRYQRLTSEGKALPDLIIIDGGLGQVGAALQAFMSIGVATPPLIGLAKKEETVVFADGREDLKLPLHHGVLRFLQRVRDEAHRFANTYNAQLRSEKIKESILDDYVGLGRVKREALLAHFGNIQKVKRATVDELREVPGLGPKLAEGLHAFLSGE